MFKDKEVPTQTKLLIGAFLLFIAVYFFERHRNPQTVSAAKSEPLYADTVIPKGFVLVPVEIANIQAVAGIIDKLGVIDLYSGGTEEKPSALIASKIKVMRAPLNPSQYAVLAPELLSREIMKHKAPFWAVVQNRDAVNSPGITPIPPAATKHIEIEYYKGS